MNGRDHSTDFRIGNIKLDPAIENQRHVFHCSVSEHSIISRHDAIERDSAYECANTDR
jgi:hypothetical protein